MAEDSDLISRADSLINPAMPVLSGGQRESSLRMRRRRSFLASTTQADTRDAFAPRTPPAVDEDDLPVLTEVVAPAAAAAPGAGTGPDAGLRLTLAMELVQRMDWQLRRELPALIEASVLGAADQLRQKIGATIETVRDDFLVQRGQLSLPLEDTGTTRLAPYDQAWASEAEQQPDPV